MSTPEFAPPLSSPDAVPAELRERGFAVLGAPWVTRSTGASPEHLAALARDWDDMPADAYLRDGGRYRRRRHSSFVVEGDVCHLVPHRAHFQSPEYNALHGGMQRWFEPMRDVLVNDPAWPRLLCGVARVCSEVAGPRRWYVEAHQFRIDTTDGIGRPTPEGAHRDGVDFVAVFFVRRHAIKGGETRVFDAHGNTGIRFTLTDPWSVLLLDDAKVIHESTPIQPLRAADASEQSDGFRDTLVLTFRRGGFQE